MKIRQHAKVLAGPEGKWCVWVNVWNRQHLCCNCFPASAKVFLQNGKSMMMSEVQIGDQVESGKFTF